MVDGIYAVVEMANLIVILLKNPPFILREPQDERKSS
jgi:hypothetical protein